MELRAPDMELRASDMELRAPARRGATASSPLIVNGDEDIAKPLRPGGRSSRLGRPELLIEEAGALKREAGAPDWEGRSSYCSQSSRELCGSFLGLFSALRANCPVSCILAADFPPLRREVSGKLWGTHAEGIKCGLGLGSRRV
jgi:hypothetical protein